MRTVLYCTACRYGSPHFRTGCVRDSFGIRSRFVRDACLPACLPAGRTVLYCTTCRYGSPHCRTGCVRYSFRIRLGFVRDACLPACLPACMQAGIGTSTRTASTVQYFIPRVFVHQSYQGYGTVGAAMRPRCGDPPNTVCTAVGKLDTHTVIFWRTNKSIVLVLVLVLAVVLQFGARIITVPYIMMIWRRGRRSFERRTRTGARDLEPPSSRPLSFPDQSHFTVDRTVVL